MPSPADFYAVLVNSGLATRLVPITSRKIATSGGSPSAFRSFESSDSCVWAASAALDPEVGADYWSTRVTLDTSSRIVSGK
jgi:hypothetical protein